MATSPRAPKRAVRSRSNEDDATAHQSTEFKCGHCGLFTASATTLAAHVAAAHASSTSATSSASLNTDSEGPNKVKNGGGASSEGSAPAKDSASSPRDSGEESDDDGMMRDAMELSEHEASSERDGEIKSGQILTRRKVYASYEEYCRERPYKCPHCDMRFKVPHAITTHVQTRHPTRRSSSRIIEKERREDLSSDTEAHDPVRKREDRAAKKVEKKQLRREEKELKRQEKERKRPDNERRMDAAVKHEEGGVAEFYGAHEEHITHEMDVSDNDESIKGDSAKEDRRSEVEPGSPFACPDCGREFLRLRNLKTHIAMKHPTPRASVRVSERTERDRDEDSEKSPDEGDSERGVKRKRDEEDTGDDPKSFRCETCGKFFRKRRRYEAHLENRHQEKRTSTRITRTTHVDMDDNKASKPFACDKCAYRGATAGALAIHTTLKHSKQYLEKMRQRAMARNDLSGDYVDGDDDTRGEHEDASDEQRPAKRRRRESGIEWVAITHFECPLCAFSTSVDVELNAHYLAEHCGTA